MEPGKGCEDETRWEVPLIDVPPRETLAGSEREVAVMDVDSEAVQGLVTADGDEANPTSADGREVDLPPSVVSPMSPSDGRLELPKTKKRRVMFADE